jgi:hypothetical protein
MGAPKREAYKAAAEEMAAYKEETGETWIAIAIAIDRGESTVQRSAALHQGVPAGEIGAGRCVLVRAPGGAHGRPGAFLAAPDLKAREAPR